MNSKEEIAVKWICIMFSVIAIAIASVLVSSKLSSKTVLTDPIAQRIWAATNVKSYSIERVTNLVRASILVDSIKEHK